MRRPLVLLMMHRPLLLELIPDKKRLLLVHDDDVSFLLVLLVLVHPLEFAVICVHRAVDFLQVLRDLSIFLFPQEVLPLRYDL